MNSKKEIKEPSDVQSLLFDQLSELRTRQLNIPDGKRGNKEYLLISEAIRKTTETLMYYFVR